MRTVTKWAVRPFKKYDLCKSELILQTQSSIIHGIVFNCVRFLNVHLTMPGISRRSRGLSCQLTCRTWHQITFFLQGCLCLPFPYNSIVHHNSWSLPNVTLPKRSGWFKEEKPALELECLHLCDAPSFSPEHHPENDPAPSSHRKNQEVVNH